MLGDKFQSNRMSKSVKHNYTDWLFAGLMCLLCVGLTVLQYRWTGEIANAELRRLRSRFGCAIAGIGARV